MKMVKFRVFLGIALLTLACTTVLAREASTTTSTPSSSSSTRAQSIKSASEVPIATGLTLDTCINTIMQGKVDVACLKLFVSKAISIGIIALSFTLKVPQIKNMLAASSCKGVDPTALYLEIFAYILTAGYNVAAGSPLTTYAEILIILAQNLIIMAICWKYLNSSLSHKTSVLLAGGMTTASFFVIPIELLPLTMTTAIIASMFSRVGQIYANYTTASTGVLSVVTVGLQVAGNIARIFTTLQEVDDFAVLSSYLIALALNLTIMLQIFYYWKTSGSAKRASDTAVPISSSSSSTSTTAPASSSERPSSRKGSQKAGVVKRKAVKAE